MNYVICFARPEPVRFPSDVLLIQKQRPAWQVGRYNLPGGKIEEDETIHEAGIRELYEEAGIMTAQIRIMGTIEGEGYIVYVCECRYDISDPRNDATSMTDEPVLWMPLVQALRDPLLIDNLRIVLPFCYAELVGWHIRTQEQSFCPTQTNVTFEEINETTDVPKPLFFGPVG